ncbi:MAG: PaaI family thioesterase [Halobacteriales archaeon]|nr:PaaI family thioesterase [Halobacteriales archaeon]
MSSTTPAVQDQLAPRSICFGCGPMNDKGLHIKSHWEGELFVAHWTPRPEHQAFTGILNGGILGALLDCHSNWCAATTLMKQGKLAELPATVTSEFHVKLKRPTPSGQELLIVARPVEVRDNVVTVEADVRAGDKVTATCRGVFVAVQPGHPAYHRWE